MVHDISLFFLSSEIFFKNSIWLLQPGGAEKPIKSSLKRSKSSHDVEPKKIKTDTATAYDRGYFPDFDEL